MSSINKDLQNNDPQRGDGGVAASIGRDKKFWKSLDELAEMCIKVNQDSPPFPN